MMTSKEVELAKQNLEAVDKVYRQITGMIDDIKSLKDEITSDPMIDTEIRHSHRIVRRGAA